MQKKKILPFKVMAVVKERRRPHQMPSRLSAAEQFLAEMWAEEDAPKPKAKSEQKLKQREKRRAQEDAPREESGAKKGKKDSKGTLYVAKKDDDNTQAREGKPLPYSTLQAWANTMRLGDDLTMYWRRKGFIE